ncbi:MAG: TetR/AcrR family transcriptional regulator [Bacteroides sp.]|nr:TetR/AcrR family transcriptional regulator [Bacteroides sp.]MCM1549199.1 TetR/AcrR family transcriptional regulator [Clostridium sp.]
MNKSESKYYNTAVKMDEAFLELLQKKDFEYITVKEICEKAGVNRSTFYLHYETVNDILVECVEYINRKCFEQYSGELKKIKDRLADADLKDLIFISPEYLQPYLEFVKENKHLFKIAISRPSALNAESTFSSLFVKIFSPILARFHYPDTEKRYVISFYISGLIAIVSEWIELDCKDSIPYIIDICMKCIMPYGKDAHLSYFQNAGGGTNN